METLLEEMELGLGIEAYIQTEILTNFVMENYEGKTNHKFYRDIFDVAYPFLEKEVTGAFVGTGEQANTINQQIALLRFRQLLKAVREKSLEKFLSRVVQIVEQQGLDFNVMEWFSNQTDTDTAILNLVDIIRKKEEAKAD